MDIKEFIIKEIAIINDNKEINDCDADLLMSEVLDSLGIVTLIGRIEEEYKIEIDADDIIPENFETMDYPQFLVERRKLMAGIIRKGYERLCL